MYQQNIIIILLVIMVVALGVSLVLMMRKKSTSPRTDMPSSNPVPRPGVGPSPSPPNKGPTCGNEIGDSCNGPADCCDGLQCLLGRCMPPCEGARVPVICELCADACNPYLGNKDDCDACNKCGSCGGVYYDM
jgi:hypothetical protein